MKLLEGKKAADHLLKGLSQEIGFFTAPPGLAFVLVGENPASTAYVRMKKKKCQEIGIVSKDSQFPASVSEKELLAHVDKLNRDPSVDGILIQLPLPQHLLSARILEAVLPEKDVDGFHPLNMGRLLLGEEGGFIPCTPLGIHTLLQFYGLSVEGKKVVIVGRSNIVGKPLAALWMQKKEGCNATVTVAHSATPHLAELTQTADVLVAALGSAHFIEPHMVKRGGIVVDVGINKKGDHLVGDVDFERVAPLVSAITPVPGGVGPMTIALLMANTVFSYKARRV